MLRLATNQAAPGMVIALPVLHPERPGHLLLKPGGRLDADIISALIQLNVNSLWIEYPPTDLLLRGVNPNVLAEHGRLAAALGAQLDRVRADVRADFEFHIFADSVRTLVHRLVEEPGAGMFVESIVAAGDPLLGHSANVCMLSLLMGLKLDGYLIEQRARLTPRRAQNVENLGLGAMLHDIGLLRVDATVAQKWWTRFDETDNAWRRHVLLGFESVRGRVPATAAGVVLHHHQRFDGSGFPRRARPPATPHAMRGTEIHIFSRIVAVADVFCRARMRPARDGTPQDAAPTVHGLRRVLEQSRAGLLDPVVLKALLAVVPAYTPGSIVELNDRRTCVVTGWDPSRPCSPEVRPLLGADRENAKQVLGAPIDLAQQPSLSIVKADGQSVSHDNFHPVNAGEFDLRLSQGGLLTDDCVEAEAA
jgi:HD-GYP domain-containing protein (c-di-GMP phosphodiesterase class II)